MNLWSPRRQLFESTWAGVLALQGSIITNYEWLMTCILSYLFCIKFKLTAHPTIDPCAQISSSRYPSACSDWQHLLCVGLLVSFNGLQSALSSPCLFVVSLSVCGKFKIYNRYLHISLVQLIWWYSEYQPGPLLVRFQQPQWQKTC